jgi:hypothetical protein
MATIRFSGQEYESVEAMPPDVRAAYESVRQVFADNDQDGLPDIFEQAGVPLPGAAGVHAAAVATTGSVAAQPPSVLKPLTTAASPVYKAGPAGLRVLWLGLFGVVGLFIVAIWLISEASPTLLAPFFRGRDMPEWAEIAGYLVLFVPATVVMMAAMFMLIQRSVVGNPDEVRELMASGEAAQAVVLRLSDTGTTINENPVARLLLEVRPRTRPAYRVETQLLLSRLAVAQVQPGAVLNVRVDPNDPRKIAFADMVDE